MDKKIFNDYNLWIKSIVNEYKKLQIKASSTVNANMLTFFYKLGQDIQKRVEENVYGSDFYNNVSKDLIHSIPDAHSFSVTNLRYMVRFYNMLNDKNLPQVVEKFGDFTNNISKNDIIQKYPQVVEDFDIKNRLFSVFNIPWGHIRLIIDKYYDNLEKAIFYVLKTRENNWSRAVLMNFIDTNLYEREGKGISNFKISLPEVQSDLAQEMTRDPYNFDFLTIKENYDEKELKVALMNNIQKFLLELGFGFAFVGREYRLEVGNTEQFLDMLFYNINLKCYVVVEVKTRDFKGEDIGQLGTYVSCVNHILKKENDNQTIGLLICKTKDNVFAKYSVESSSEPLAISEYELSKLYPENFKSSMPTIEEIEKGI